ncbi:hypothetical protein Mapa_002014 [Marchantia paleacea]|nr:hypothetical protein Mapa_002014 [Marchantia paleacea]
MHNLVIAQLLLSRKQKEEDKKNFNLIEEDINRILRATGSHNPLFQEANRGIIFSKSFKPKDWRKKKRQDPILADIAYFNLWSLMLTPDIATAFMEALLTRINDMDIEEEINPEHMKIYSTGPQREWDFGKEYEVKDAEPYCPGHPLVRRTFNFFTKIPPEFRIRIHTSMRAAVLNTIILLMFFHPINYKTPRITAALVAVTPDPLLERMNLSAWKGVASYPASLKCIGFQKPSASCFIVTQTRQIWSKSRTSSVVSMLIFRGNL